MQESSARLDQRHVPSVVLQASERSGERKRQEVEGRDGRKVVGDVGGGQGKSVEADRQSEERQEICLEWTLREFQVLEEICIF